MPLKLGNISRLTIGVQGDNASGPIRIDVSEWLSQWPDGIITVWNLRHGTTESYPVATTVEDGILTWSPTSADTQYEGAGLCRFTITEDGIVKNSVNIPTKVFPGLPGTTSSDPPDPYVPWVTQVVTAAEHVEGAIIHSPKIDEDTGNWFVWDTDSDDWVDTEVSAHGVPGDPGVHGEAGFSPSASVSKSGRVATITITDKDGTTTAQVSDADAGSWDDIADKPETFPPSAHTHDDRYYTENETDTLLFWKAASNHDHNGVYSPVGHNHDTEYSAIGHNHDSNYSAIDHTHTASEISYSDTTVEGAIGSLYNDIVPLTTSTLIPNGSDLDTYKTPGNYCTQGSSQTASLSHCPVSSGAIKLIVEPGVAAGYVVQHLIVTGQPISCFRSSTSATAFGEWNEAVIIENNAGFHNSLYRGKNLGSSVTAAQWAAISSGSFDDLFIGDYWTINGVNWRIAAFDYWYNCGDTACTTHHVVIVPDSNLTSGGLNSTNITTGAYVGSDYYTGNNSNTMKATAKTAINNAFGSGHILSHREYLANATTNGYQSAGAWYDSTFELMTEQMVYGGKVFGSQSAGSNIPSDYTIGQCQLPLFRHDKSRICIRAYWWLRDVVSAPYFALVASHGCADCDGASNGRGIRPAFGIRA